MLIENLNSSSVTSNCYGYFLLPCNVGKVGGEKRRIFTMYEASGSERKTFPDMIEFSAVIYMVRWSAFILYPRDWKVGFLCCALLCFLQIHGKGVFLVGRSNSLFSRSHPVAQLIKYSKYNAFVYWKITFCLKPFQPEKCWFDGARDLRSWMEAENKSHSTFSDGHLPLSLTRSSLVRTFCGKEEIECKENSHLIMIPDFVFSHVLKQRRHRRGRKLSETPSAFPRRSVWKTVL